MAESDNDKPTIVDALADAAIRTVAKYEQHIENGQYVQGIECLHTVAIVTSQVQQIEENKRLAEMRYPTAEIGYTN